MRVGHVLESSVPEVVHTRTYGDIAIFWVCDFGCCCVIESFAGNDPMKALYERIIRTIWSLLSLLLCGAAIMGLILFIGWMQGCTLHVSFDKHYKSEPREEAAAGLIERIFEGDEEP